MFARLIELALSKASSDAEVDALRPVLAAAVALDEEEQSFGDRIDSNDVQRDEAPAKLSKRKRAELDGYATDALKMESRQLEEFSEFESSSSIVSCLKTALDCDVSFWTRAHERCHAAETKVVKDFAAAKIHLRDAMVGYLSTFHAGRR